MGKRGPAKQPQELLELKGTAQKCRARSAVVVGAKLTSIEQVDEIFDYSRLSERGQRIFLQRCVFLIGLHLLEASYLDAVLLYAQNYDMALRCMRSINKEGWYVKVLDKNGNFKGFAENPRLKTFDKLCKTINMFGTQFGFTPASRMGLHLQDTESDKPDVMDITTDAIEI